LSSPSDSAGEGFRPAAWSRGGHRQTLIGYWVRSRLVWPQQVEDVVVVADEDVRLLVRASWQAERERKPTLMIVHGLGGSSEGSYGLSLGLLAWRQGWNVARMNLRGAGDGEALCARLYNAGLDGDVIAALQALARITPRVALAGFSLGGNLTALAWGRGRERLPAGAFAAAAVSPPLDLAACADALDSARNRLYCLHYLRQLRASYERRQRALPALYEAGRERSTRTIREYDDRITAHYGGFAGAADYYARSSAGPWLASVERPLLVLAAADDPLIPIESVARWPLPGSGSVEREITATGGHVGFLAPSRAPGRFWAADRVLAFLAARA
jgi:predicted alpha/beta-fold hydrolase